MSEYSRVSQAINTLRSKVNGLYVPKSQSEMIPDSIQHQIISIPSSSAPSFGGSAIIDIKQNGTILHDLSLALTLSPCTGTTGGTLPNLSTGFLLIDRIEFRMGNGNIFYTVFGLEQFLIHQIMESDSVRTKLNNSVGNYNSAANRNSLFVNSGTYYIHLKSVLDVIRPMLFNDQNSIQLNVVFRNLNQCYNANGATGSVVCNMISLSALCQISRLDQSTLSFRTQEISRFPYQNLFLDLRPASFIVPTGVTQSSSVLSQVTGNVVYLMFVVKPTSASITSTTFTQLRSFSISDSTGTSITTGQNVPDGLAKNLQALWSRSSYGCDNEAGSHFYAWSFSANPIDALKHGVDSGSFKFNGTQSLNLVFNTTTAETFTVDLFCYVESVCEQTLSGFRKIAIA